MRHNIILFLIFIIAGVFLFRDISKPFFGLHENNSVLFSIYAKNILENGLLATKVCGTGYIGHPCLLQVLLAGFYRIGGITEVTGRLLPILASLGSVYLVYLLGKKLFGETIGLVSAGIMVFLPSFITFGDLISHEMILLFFALLGFNFFLNQKIYLSLISFGLAAFVDWPGFYLLGILLVFLFFFGQRNQFWRFLAGTILITLIVFGHLLWVNGGDFNSFTKIYKNLFIGRSGLVSKDFSNLDLLSKVYFREKLLFTPEIILTSFLGLGLVLIKFFKEKKKQPFLLLLLLLLFATLHVLIFRGGWYLHFFWSYYFIPFLSISSAYFIVFFVKKLPKGRVKISGLTLCLIFFLFYVNIALRNVKYFDSLYDKNLEEGIAKLNQETKGEKVFLLTSGYSTLVLQYYLKGGFVLTPEQASWAVAWVLPDTTTDEQKLIDDVCHKYSCQTITEEGNYPMFRLAKL